MFREDQNESRKRRDGVTIKEVVVDFFSVFVSSIGDRMNSLVEKQERKMKKDMLLILVFMVGALYMLKGLALFINDYLGKGEWLGYGLVGIVLVVIGMIFRK